ncbi:MAG TPA: protein kinase, partial [Gemmataceae bacterium]|nr:protein kinase [Gemmataceae bacterium]
MNTVAACPDSPTLQEYLLGRMSEEAAAVVEAHLASCPDCRKRLPAIPAEDDFVAEFRAQGLRPQPNDALLDRMVDRLRGVVRVLPVGQDTPPPVASEETQTHGPSLTPAQQPDEIGRLGGYRILKELGRGGMGVVYKAEDPKLKRLVALKAMLPSVAADAAQRQRFLREAQAMAAVHHDHVATIFQVDETDGVPFLAMELLQGEALSDRLAREEKVPPAETVRIGREIAEGLAAAHATGLIHRDIKPANIWLEAPRGRVKILDFGLARPAAQDSGITQLGGIVGTPSYMAPEQARGESVDGRCDLFSLGVLLYRLCTGRQPFRGIDAVSTLLEVVTHDPPAPSLIEPAVPPPASELVMRLLDKSPAGRPASAGEVAETLQALEKDLAGRAAADATALQPAPTEPAADSRGRKRRPWILAAVAAGFLALAAAATIIVIRYKDKDGKTQEVKIELPKDAHDVSATVKPNDAAGAAVKPVDDAWIKQVADLPSTAKQVDAVAAKLKELNPGFDGKIMPTVEGGVVTGLDFVADDVADISPVRALPALKSLSCQGSGDGKGRLSDLSPLKGMTLTSLHCGSTNVADLSPVQGMPLRDLWCYATPVSDLSPLKGMPLKMLHLAGTQVSDLSPLKVMKLTSLDIDGTKVSDLTPLKGMPLTNLQCCATKVSDLTPLKGMPLTSLFCHVGTPISDFSPLKGLPLKVLYCDFDPKRDAEVLRSIPTLETINGKPAMEVLGQPAVAAKPVDDAWVKEVAALPSAVKQRDAVAAKMKELNPGFDGKLTPATEGGTITELEFSADGVTNLSPLRALPGLRRLVCHGSG